MKIENWSDLDREMFCGGMFAQGRHDEVAVKDWRSKSEVWPDEVLMDEPKEEKKPTTLVAFVDQSPGPAHLKPKQRKDLEVGKRAPFPRRNTMDPGTWHVSKGWVDEKSLSDELLGRQVLDGAKWSEALTACAVDGKPLQGADRKYCSDECRRIGSNTVRRAKTRRRRFPTDEWCRYLQSPPPPRVAEPNVHKYWVWESQVPHTVSRNYRLRFPWAREPKAWKIGMV